jgi:hypothetical protein
MAAIALTDILRGRVYDFDVQTAASVSIVKYDNLMDGLLTFDEEIKRGTYEIEDSREIEMKHGRKANIEQTISAIDTTIMTSITSTGDKVIVSTATGGANGTGLTLTLSGMATPGTGSLFATAVEGGKMKITGFVNSYAIATIPYTITDNAA